jgi:S1-C subfamily serine protease
VILAVNDVEVNDSQSILRMLTPMKSGQKVRLRVWSHGNVKTVNVVLDTGRGD